MYLQKIVSTHTSLYCKLCRSVRHDEKDYRAYQLLQEKAIDAYLMKNYKHMQVERDHAQFFQPRGAVLLEAEDKDKDLVEGNDKLFSTDVDDQDIMLENALILR